MFLLHKRLSKWRQNFVKIGLPFFVFLCFFVKRCEIRTIQLCSNITSMERLYTSNVSNSKGNKIRGRKNQFCSNLPLNLFRVAMVTVANADIESLKSLHTLFDRYLYHMLGNFEQIIWSKIREI